MSWPRAAGVVLAVAAASFAGVTLVVEGIAAAFEQGHHLQGVVDW